MPQSQPIEYLEGHTGSVALFSPQMVDSSIESITFQNYRPIGQLSNTAHLEFQIGNSSSDYIDLQRTRLALKIKVLNSDGTNLAADDTMTGLINLPHSTLFSQADLLLNNKLVSKSTPPSYAYIGYINRCFEHSKSAKDSYLQTEGYFPDTAEAFDSSSEPGNGENKDPLNSGHFVRCKKTAESKVLQLIGPLHIDFFQQKRYLLGNVSVFIRLWQNPDRFRIHSPIHGAEKQYKLEIVDAELQIACVKPNADLVVAHNEVLEKSMAIYPFTKDSFHMYAIPSGQFNFTIDNMYPEKMPTKLYCFFVASKAFNGEFTRNPLNFIHAHVESVAFSIDGINYPSRAIETNYDDDSYVEAYLTQYYANCSYNCGGNDISYHDFAKGFCIYVIDLAPGVTEGDNYIPYPKRGNARLSINFRHGLEEATTLGVLSKTPSSICIDKTRSVIV